MTSRGETSGARDEEFTDIQVDTERLIGYAPLSPVPSESEGDEDVRAEVAEPVWGGVLRSGGQDTDGDESEEDPTEIEPVQETAEEVPEEGSPIFHTYEEDLLGEYADRIIEQEQTLELRDARIAHLEQENQVHQQMEDQYRDQAYTLQVQVTELQAQLQQAGQAAPQPGPTVQQLMLQNSHLRQTIEHSGMIHAELQVLYQATRSDLEIERADGVQVREAWARAATRVDDLEGQYRDQSVRADSLEYALTTAVARLRHRIRRYPREAGSSRRMIRRRVVDRIARQELRRAIRRISQ